MLMHWGIWPDGRVGGYLTGCTPTAGAVCPVTSAPGRRCGGVCAFIHSSLLGRRMWGISSCLLASSETFLICFVSSRAIYCHPHPQAGPRGKQKLLIRQGPLGPSWSLRVKTAQRAGLRQKEIGQVAITVSKLLDPAMPEASLWTFPSHEPALFSPVNLHGGLSLVLQGPSWPCLGPVCPDWCSRALTFWGPTKPWEGSGLGGPPRPRALPALPAMVCTPPHHHLCSEVE